ncbi:complex I subunit 5 family protein [Alkaliphilus peptidifermentans]|uniref:Formate hydrogenlyase subunit 3/Multisubunit Na+/H+ antiporter, MnhD subunit n=1 Tax=Alkaliphilus peptidifermentans DSM 18978 TaxID=1120976 RepID=A0A1G5GFS9_9FIRM|nr:complex I subunit 5 family protein [Alkaliphilus peptidifermentans]SCY49548.1 Formate hydrogenlyase subunit 3/Multisubunit Na+/H+ antiporter, MnhD subunit [Alkaliphilus peptidifermentans DSM 18978]
MNILRVVIMFWLPAVVIFFGLFEALIIPLLDDSHRLARRISVNAFIIFTTILIMLTYNQVKDAPIVYEFGRVFGMGIFFKIDLLNYILMVFAGIIFTISSIYSLEDIKQKDRERTFYFFYIITYVATIGTLMAGDLLSFFLFFEIMTFSSYGLMVHYRGEEVLEAGNVYIYMGIIGGLSILSGIILLSAYTQSYEWINLADKFSQLGFIKYVIGGLFIFGFGVKAGMVPFHFWLPKIYREAPITVNAISSGILTKVGAYGILRVATIIYSVSAVEASTANVVLWNTSTNLGVVIIWLGIITMVVGVFLALLESNMKKMLAYHSISQMGYIIMGIGVAAYLGYKGAMGFSGSIYHMVNHGFFKSLLFMVAGVVYLHTKELDMYRLGGLWKKMPFAALVALVAVLGITGMPGFNGFASKSILHHAIIEAYEYGHPSFRYAELIFKLVSAGTVCSFLKFFGFIFMGECPPQYENLKPRYPRMAVAMGTLAFIVVAIGIRPEWFLNRFIIPAVLSFTYDPVFVEKYIVGINFWNMKDIMGMVMVYGMGIGIFVVGVKYHLFHHHLPSWLNAERFIYRPVTQFCEGFPNMCVQKYEKPMVLGDVFIYVTLLTLILGALVVTGF